MHTLEMVALHRLYGTTIPHFRVRHMRHVRDFWPTAGVQVLQDSKRCFVTGDKDAEVVLRRLKDYTHSRLGYNAWLKH